MISNRRKSALLVALVLSCLTVHAQTEARLTYNVEMSAYMSTGDYAPLWFTANRNGLSSQKLSSGYLRAGLELNQPLRRGWRIGAGVDVAGMYNSPTSFSVQQGYVDISWRMLDLSIGSKERMPLGKNPYLSSGAMVEGNNMRPIPQIRAEIADYYTVPGTKGWFAFKGHLAYGWFTDGSWQKDFAGKQQMPYLKNVLYHSKQLMLKGGNKEKFPLEAEVGLLMAAQFGGELHSYNKSTGKWSVSTMPHGLKNYVKVFMAQTGGADTAGGDQVNVEGNHVGSWNAALKYYIGDWKF